MPFDSTNLNKEAAHLLRAKNDIADHGWCQQRPLDDDGRRCVLMALDQTRASGASVWDAGRYLAKALGIVGSHDIVKWQDAPDRTIGEVFSAFDAAVALAMDAAP